jgi:hypothetical protein
VEGALSAGAALGIIGATAGAIILGTPTEIGCGAPLESCSR